MIVAWLDNTGKCVVSDRHTTEYVDENSPYPVVDDTQTVKSCSGSSINGVVSISYNKPFKTLEPTDKEITNTTMNFIWSTSDVAPETPTAKMTKHDETSRGYTYINFFTGVTTPIYSQYTWCDKKSSKNFCAKYQIDLLQQVVHFEGIG
jgi:hypothetical protein